MSSRVTKKPSARERLLRASDELFYTEGIHTVGIDRVLEKADVAKGSLYYNFAGGKEELVSAYLAGRHAAWEKVIDDGIAGAGPDARARLLSIFDSLAILFARPDYRGCAFVNAVAEAEPGGVEEAASERFREWLHGLIGGLVAELPVDDAASVTDQLVILYDGATTTAQMDKRASAATTARRMAELIIDASRAGD
ncbi:TetR/AcrR family transcriptional regulator [Leifsonia poae]|uniref:TetR/AcrR family transcriptional regulator n=1 Tax=Leifsonia poae TaxID=110933 RepID=UPI003D69C58A